MSEERQYPSRARLVTESAFGLAVAAGGFWGLREGWLDAKWAGAMILFGGFFVSRFLVKEFFKTILMPFARMLRGMNGNGEPKP